MKFLPLVLIKRKLLRWSPEKSRPEIVEWQIGDKVGGNCFWAKGEFQGITNKGRIVFRNYEARLVEIALWRGVNYSLRNRRIQASLSKRLEPELMPLIKSDYRPGQWVN